MYHLKLKVTCELEKKSRKVFISRSFGIDGET